MFDFLNKENPTRGEVVVQNLIVVSFLVTVIGLVALTGS